MKEIAYLSAETIREIREKKELEFIYQKIYEATKNFKDICYINCNYRLNNKNVEYLRENGFKITSEFHYDNGKTSLYSYEISWQ